jgi:hypothetical protein
MQFGCLVPLYDWLHESTFVERLRTLALQEGAPPWPTDRVQHTTETREDFTRKLGSERVKSRKKESCSGCSRGSSCRQTDYLRRDSSAPG